MTPFKLRVGVFEGGWNLPLWVAQDLGFFEERGLDVSLLNVRNSVSLIQSLYGGEIDFALAAADNFIAYQHADGEVHVDRSDDLRIVMGGDDGFLSLVARPGIRTIADLKGCRLGVDAATTGFAFVLRAMLRHGGVSDDEVELVAAGGTSERYRRLCAGEFDATLLRTPFETLAGLQGFGLVAGTDFLGPYQGTVGAVRARWAELNTEVLVSVLRAYARALTWCLDPANRAGVCGSLRANLPGVPVDVLPDVAGRLLDGAGGFRRQLDVDFEGLRTVIGLREQFGVSHIPLQRPDRYVEQRYLTLARRH